MQRKKIATIFSIVFVIYVVLAIVIANYFYKWEIIRIYIAFKTNMKNYESSGMIQKDGDIDDNLIKKVDKYYMLIPENVRNSYEENGWDIFVTDENLGSDTVIGLFVPSEKTIYIDNRIIASYAIIHEIGHYIDYTMQGYRKL